MPIIIVTFQLFKTVKSFDISIYKTSIIFFKDIDGIAQNLYFSSKMKLNSLLFFKGKSFCYLLI